MPAAKPLLIYDGRCGFCRIWIDYWQRLTGDRVDYAPAQEVGEQYPQIPGDAFGQSVQLVRPDGSTASGARAVFETLGKERLYEAVPGLAGAAEAAYRVIARHRSFFYQVTRFTFGTRIEPTRFAATQWIFVRALAVIYSIAFISLSVQVSGLLGSRGILPAGDYLGRVAQHFGAVRYFILPTIFWWGSDDLTLTTLSIAGGVLAGLLLVTGFRRGVFERPILGMLFILYLSYSSASQEFLSYQWDALLLETGFLAIFLGGTRVVPWLFRWLVFRFYFLSGAVKLLSHDPTWRDLSALSYHYHTQPLPTVAAWYASLLPMWFHRASTAMVFAIELGIPFLIFAPRRLRMFGAAWLIGFQVLIMITGNYAFFNWLTIVLCLFLFDDQALSKMVPRRVRERLSQRGQPRRREWMVAGAMAAIVLTLGLTRMASTFLGSAPEPLETLVRWSAPFQIVNSYGLFAVMTTTRPEIVVEGSEDGERWLPYGFPYKAGDLNQAPRWVAPHQPRPDWQMWFAALGDLRSNTWFVNFMLRLLDGSEPVKGLLAQDPFPGHPPRYVRATLYEYSFADWQTHRRTGAWWTREVKGAYLPAVGLRSNTSPEAPGTPAPSSPTGPSKTP